MQVCFAIEGFCKTGFINRLSGKYRRPEFIADTLQRVFWMIAYRMKITTVVPLVGHVTATDDLRTEDTSLEYKDRTKVWGPVQFKSKWN